MVGEGPGLFCLGPSPFVYGCWSRARLWRGWRLRTVSDVDVEYVGAVQAGAVQVGAVQFGAAQIGAAQVGAAQVGVFQVGVA